MSAPYTPESPTPGPHQIAVVGIGASAGGLKPLLEIIGRVAPDAGIAFVVIVHLAREHESNLVGLLQNTTRMPVTDVTERTPIRADTVYVISPRNQLSVADGHLVPTVRDASSHPFSIDLLFRTLAEAHGNRAIAVVLSGTGSDGTEGVRHIRAHGGVSLAQLPADAEHDAMPRNAIGSGAVDFVLPAAEIADRLQAVWRSAQKITLPDIGQTDPPENAASRAEETLAEILALVKVRTGHDFAYYKRSTLMRRIERRLQVNQLTDLATYRDFLADHAEETPQLLRDLLISVTSFFRDPAAFDALARNVVPLLLARRGTRVGDLRIWVVGCATGEEVYSIAMLFAEQLNAMLDAPGITIFATDIDEHALTVARAGLYPDSIAETVSRERLERFFTKEPRGYRVQRRLRDLITFASHNLLHDPPFSRIDFVSCRNVLIYLSRSAQRRVLDILHFAVRVDGCLLLGSAESIDEANNSFVALDKQHRIFQRQPRRESDLTDALPPDLETHRVPRDHDVDAGRRLFAYGELHQQLLEYYGPPSVVVDEHFDIVHLSESAGRYLQIGAGEASLNILRSVPVELRTELRDALAQAMQTMLTAQRRNLPLAHVPQNMRLNIRVHPVVDKRSGRNFALIVFEEVTAADELAEPTSDAEQAAILKLQGRLADTEALLRGAIAQYEVRNEELKASNEELQATNEELHATSEELETGKEELQSINEELQTVNQELKNKVDETSRIRDDLQNFINATEIAVLFVDRDQRLLRFTPLARRIFNVLPGDIGRPLTDITNRLIAEDFSDELARLFETLAVSEREVRGVDGRRYLLRILPYRTTDDRIGGAVLTFFDDTERKLAQEAVQRNEAWLRLMLDSVVDYAILTLDANGVITAWNRGAELIFGFTGAEAVGQHFQIFFTAEDRAAGTPENELRVAREAGRAEDERWQIRKDGSRFFASGVVAPLLDAARFGYVKLLRDVTEHQVAQQRRDALLAQEQINRAAAEEASRMKDEFVATLSHELRNPLALIQMQTEILLRAPETRRTQRLASAAEIIHQTVKAQAQLVDDLLDVSRARTGKLAIDRQLVPLPLLIADSIGALRDEAERNSISLTIDFAAEPLIVEADAVRVKQIAWNLLSNALKFTPHGGNVVVRLRRDGSEARLDVEDNGQGIAPDMLAHIFEWFRQAETGSTRRKGGMGIGLALVRQLVELHGGRVQGRSEGIGKGACFTVWLPLQIASAQRLPALAAPVPDAIQGRLPGVRVLIIDDAPANAEALRELLMLEGAFVGTETTAHDAIKRAHSEAFDVIISDLAMPEMDGYAMLKEVRNGTLNRATPAIAYSGYGGPEEMARSKAAGFDLHITKPVDLDRLIDTIRSLARSAAQARAPALKAVRGGNED